MMIILLTKNSVFFLTGFEREERMSIISDKFGPVCTWVILAKTSAASLCRKEVRDGIITLESPV